MGEADEFEDGMTPPAGWTRLRGLRRVVPVAQTAAVGGVVVAGLSLDDYAETHVPLGRRLPGLQRLETARLVGTAEGGAAPYYRIAELWFADVDRLQAAAASPEGEALAADVANFATGGVTVVVAQVDEDGAPTTAGTPGA